MRLNVAVAAMLLAGMTAPAGAATIYVNGTVGNDDWDGLCEEWDGGTCGPKATIQAGIDAANDGDEVLIACGTYTGAGNKDLDFGGKAITVRSATGEPECVIIDCEEEGRGFNFHSGEGPDAIVEGLTITNGEVWGGGGVRCINNSSPTLTNCTINGNSARYGGGVLCRENSCPTLKNCTISGNSGHSGGASEGGGVCCTDSSPTLTNCTISGNYADYRGGGVYCEFSSPTLTNCTISGNTGRGGGVYCYARSFPRLTNCTFSGNSSYGVNCTGTSSVTLTNCILWGDTPREITGYGDTVVIYCAVQGGWDGEGNIDADPLLTPDGHLTAGSPCFNAGDPDGDYSGQTDMDGELRLIDYRVDIGTDEWLDTDTDGLPDWWEQLHFDDPHFADPQGDEDMDGRVNLQEYELGSDPWRAPRTYYVCLAGNDEWDGLAPEWDGEHGPKATIQAAIDVCDPYEGDEVVIADGTYTGAGNRELDFGGKAITVRSATGEPECVIIDCEGEGRGLYFHYGEGANSIVEGLTIMNGNADGSYGGGVRCSNYSSPTITNCTISGNLADEGGGVCCNYSSPTLTNCTISGNYADYRGGGVYCDFSSPTLTNCTISGNYADYRGGGVCCYYDSSPTLTNCILWGDAHSEIDVESGSPVVTYCDVQGGWLGEGNIDADPFAFPDDLHLAWDSPCIDAGMNDPPGGLPADDLDGNPRPLDGDGDTVAVADMGAFEFNPDAPSIALSPTATEFTASEGGQDPADQLLSLRNCGGGTLNWEITGQPAWLTVSPSAGESNGEVNPVTLTVDVTGLAHGAYYALLEVADPQAVNSPREVVVTLYVIGTLHVPDEYPTIQAAIDASFDGDVVQIANGTYTGPGNRELDFGGKAITVRSASGDPSSCVIDCEEEGCGFYFHSREGPDSIVEGLTIMNGNADYDGGGVRCVTISSPTITHCNISGNSDSGMYNEHSSPTVTSCTFSGNHGFYGAGMRNELSRPTVTNCTFSGNDGHYGAGMSNHYSSPTVTNCTFDGNMALSGDGFGGQGGGMYNGEISNPTMTNCTFSGNYARSSGGGMHNYYSTSSLTLTNCKFDGNMTGGGGGGIYNDGGSPTLTNCTFSANTAGYSGGGMANPHNDSPTVTNCILWGDSPDEIMGSTTSVAFSNVQGGWPGEGNIDADPLFVDPDGPDDDPTTWEDNDYRLSPGSPCTDAGNTTALPLDEHDLDGDGDTTERIPMDLAGMPRCVDDPLTEDTGVPDPPDYPEVVDMGAYEFGFEGCPDYDGDGLVTLCHIPPGHPERARTITVGVAASAAHLAHGDYCGPCEEGGRGPSSGWVPDPLSDPMLADINGDGDVNSYGIDGIEPFIELLFGP